MIQRQLFDVGVDLEIELVGCGDPLERGAIGRFHPLEDGVSVVIPSGVEHNVVNTSKTEPLRLYTLYGPPEHPDGTVHRTKADEPGH